MSSVPSYLLPGYSHVVLDVSKHGGLDEVSSVSRRSASTHQPGSFPLPAADVAQNLVELLLIHLDRSSQRWGQRVPTSSSTQCTRSALPEVPVRSLSQTGFPPVASWLARRSAPETHRRRLPGRRCESQRSSTGPGWKTEQNGTAPRRAPLREETTKTASQEDPQEKLTRLHASFSDRIHVGTSAHQLHSLLF